MYHSSYIILQVEVIDVTLTVVSLITPFQLRRILAKVHSPRSSQYFSSILNNKVVDCVSADSSNQIRANTIFVIESYHTIHCMLYCRTRNFGIDLLLRLFDIYLK